MQRAEIVLYVAEGQSDVEIAARLDTSSGIVGRWRTRFCAERLEGLQDRPRAGRPRCFPLEPVAEVKAIACELPGARGLPLSRFSRTELHRLVIERGVREASVSTIWRWLTKDAIKPWQVRTWIFRRDPELLAKASRALDLYARRFEGKRLRSDEYVISADEKSQLQALGRRHPTTPAGPRQTDATRVRLRPRRHPRLSRRLGRPPRQPLRPDRGEDRDRALRPPGLRSDGK